MAVQLVQKRITELFIVKSGDFHAINELDPGNTPLVSCGDMNNGVVGFYTIPENCIYSHAITVAYNGQPLTTKFHPYSFGAKDDVAVLIPRSPVKESTLLFFAVLLNALQWRYSYGRKCYREKLQNVILTIPMVESGGNLIIDEETISRYCPVDYSSFIPNWLNNLVNPTQ